MTVPRLSPAFRRPLARRSSFIVSWQARGLSLDADTGQTGVGSFAASANVIATDGTTVAAVAGMPRWQVLDLEAGIAGRESPSLWLGSPDTLAWTVAPVLGNLTMALRFVQPATFPALDAALLHLGNDTATGMHWVIGSTGSQYRTIFSSDGITAAISTMAVTAPTAGQVVLLRVTLATTGVVQIHQTIDGGTETSAAPSGTWPVIPLPTGARLQLNGVGVGFSGTTSFGAIRAWLAPGTAWTPTTLEAF